MSDNIVKTSGTTKNYKDDRGGAALIPSAVIGIVKHNIDDKRSGMIKVYLQRLDAGDENNPDNWTPARYLSPFFGTTPNTSSPTNNGSFKGNPQSYGMWFTPPDLNTEVVCICMNGDINSTYYIGSIPKIGLMHMVPAIGSSDNIIANAGESDSYGGATRLPVGEINNANKAQDNNSVLIDQPRPVHSFQAAILNKQGLIRDPDRGTISSSSSRESPSKVFGISTPGRAIYEGGYGGAGQKTIAEAVKDPNIPDKNFKVVGRIGGHSLVMDDGDLQGKDQLFRLRTAQGHMIMMNDTIQSLFIIHANGQSYIEMGKEGTIDMYSTNSVNIRTQGDLNLHADNNININAKKDLNISAENIKMESSMETTQFSGTTFTQQTKGNHTVKVDGGMSFASKGDSSIKSGGTNYLNGGPNIKLNTGSSPLVPGDVKAIPKVAHTDTLFDDKKGYAAAPATLLSVTSRAPAHSPWASANQGVNVKTTSSASATLPAAPSPAVQAANNAASPNPSASTTPAVAATVPPVQNKGTIDNSSKGAMVSQVAVNASTGPAKDAVASGAAITSEEGAKSLAVGPLGITPAQMESQGMIKPGTAQVVAAAVTSGKSITEALPKNFFTGKNGVGSVNDLVNNVPAQLSAVSESIDKAQSGLVSSGVLTGKESPTQTGGLILSAVTLGVDKTASFVKSAVSGTTLPEAPAGVSVQNPFATAGRSITPPTLTATDTAKAKDLVAGGNKATQMADQTTGPLSSVQLTDKLKSAAASAFAAITKAFKPLAPGVPQNLTAIKAQATEEKIKEETATSVATQNDPNFKPAFVKDPVTGRDVRNFSDAELAQMKKNNGDLNASLTNGLGLQAGGSLRTTIEGVGTQLKGSLSNTTDPKTLMAAGPAAIAVAGTQLFGSDAGGIDGLPGGMSSVSNMVNLGDNAKAVMGTDVSSANSLLTGLNIPGKPNIPGASPLTGAISAIKQNSNSGVSTLKDKLQGGNDSIKNLASSELSSADNAKLAGAINSVSGSTEVKLPTVASDTFDFGPQLAQASSLLGDSKIPGVSFGAIPASAFKMPTAAQAKEYDKLKAELKIQEDLQWDLRKKYFDAKTKKGADASETIAAQTAWQDCVKKIDEIKGQMYANTTGNPPPAPGTSPSAPTDVNQNLTAALGMQKGGSGQAAVENIGSTFKNSLGI